MRRYIGLVVGLLAVASCRDGYMDTLGPEEEGRSVGGAPSFDHVPGSPSSCLDEALDPAWYATSGGSPCDAGTSGNEHTNLLAPLRGTTVDGLGPLAADLLPYLRVDAICVSSETSIQWPPAGEPRDPTPGCRDFRDLSVSVIDGSFFQAKFRTNKKKDPPNAAYQVLIYLDFGGTGSGALLAWRTVGLTDDPSIDTPSDAALFVAQNGSTNPINFHISQSIVDCPPDAPISVTCLIDNDGGRLSVLNPSGNVASVLNVGPGNGLNFFTLTLSECEQIDVDVPRFGCAVDITSSTFDATPTNLLQASSISICENLEDPALGLTADQIAAIRVAQADADGISILPEAGLDCTSSLSALPTSRNLWARAWSKVTALAGARPLNAAVGVKSGGGGDIRRLSDVQLVLPAAVDVNSATLPEDPVEIGDPVLIDLQALTANDAAAPGTVLRVFSTDGSLQCPTSPPADTNDACDDSGGGGAGDVVVTTGDAGAQVLFAPSVTGTAVVDVLGCGVAVPGSDTPSGPGDFDVLGTLNGSDGCDRDPTDDADPAAGPHNGPGAGLDPFVDATYEVAINDRPFHIPVTVCSPQSSADVDGVKESAWDCADSVQFPVNLPGGGKGDGPLATLLWMNDGDSLYLAVQLPRESDETDTSLWFEFDLGRDGDRAVPEPDGGEDLIGVIRDKSDTADPTTGAFGAPQDRYVDSGCAGSSGSSLCDPAVAETSNDVHAGVQFNAAAGYIFYELSHPLDSGDANDFHLSEGDLVGVFLRLAVGNGAQGNTVWPGFRVYENPAGGASGPPILIKGPGAP